MLNKIVGLFILTLYLLVFFVALEQGPLVSTQSFILGVLGLIVILLIVSSIAMKIRLVDISDEPRKQHIGKIPLVGGIGIYVSLVYGAFVFGVSNFYFYVLASLIPIMIVGIIDGIHGVNVKPVYRIIAQILSSWIIILTTDIYLKDLGNILGIGTLYIGQLGIPFTIFAVVGICNAFNMIDGKDGLLGSITVIIICSLLWLLYVNNEIYQWGQILVFSILVYLAFNLGLFGKKRKIFLGDHGSTALGHIIAWSLIDLSQESKIITSVSALWFVLLPLTDCLLTFARRTKSSASILVADRLHFHHKLSDMGYSDNKILLLFCLITIVSCAIALASNIFGIDESIMFYAFITLLAVLSLLGFINPTKDNKD